ncbi:hypothetical protein HanIR_Chr12g0612451 [Helianthus annuus]|nr:hypothetical protein HanIR_Chr12g0612451 [Helianthus annuus]
MVHKFSWKLSFVSIFLSTLSDMIISIFYLYFVTDRRHTLTPHV